MLMPNHLVFGFDQTLCLFFFPFVIVYFDIRSLNFKCKNPLRGSQLPKSKEKTKNDKKKQHKKWTITHQMCTHYYLIGGTTSPTNK
jgi:hypothetical protein